MRTAGIVCEYNPFHNGHLDHMERTRKLPGSDYIVCVMSSDFLQRGEPAILPKETRAATAVMNGADLVFEIPSVFSCASAEYYASYAVSMMARLGIVDSVVFGSEKPDMAMMERIAGLLIDEPPELSELIKSRLSEGLSFARARELALSEYTGLSEASDFIEGSNNILGIEYTKAILKNRYPMKPVAIPRIAEEYKQTYIEGRFPSATAIRKSIIDSGIGSVREFLPRATFSLLDSFYKGKAGYIRPEMLRDIIFYRLASLAAEELREFDGVSEGLENRLRYYLGKADTLAGYIDMCSTKRYPMTRIARALVYILLDIRKDELEKIREKGPVYSRLLAASQRGMSLIPVIERNSSIPVFTSYKQFYENSSERVRKLLDLERKASDIYSTAAGIPIDREYTIQFRTYEKDLP